MEIRKALLKDINEICNVVELARNFMESYGNTSQWNNGYPSKDLLLNDIKKGYSYVITENNKIVGTFSFIIGDDITYQVIEDGAWHYNRKYGVIHRLASSGEIKGIAKTCFDFCSDKIDYLRIDTHKDNLPMQKVIKKYGFKECGSIYVLDGTKRIAFDYEK